MVAVIKTGRSIHRIFNYNENKVKEGVARCIGQGNYPVEATRMSAGMRLNRLLKRAALNPNVKRNSVHISLNFDPSEKLSDEDMNSIAHTYMKGIGFSKQPYLIYRHEDAGHPHLHICSVNIRADGRRIDMNNIGRNQSERARKDIEQNFGLVVAEGQHKTYALDPVNVEKASYGKRTTKAAIQTVLQYVLDRYRYASLPELNAVLNLYNVAAERGGEDSVMYRHNGLQFCLLDDKGNRIGIPLKASLFYNKPILKNLQERFLKNKPKKLPHKLKLKNALDKALANTDIVSLGSLKQDLETKGIHLRLRQSTEGHLYGVTFVDHRTHCVFNGSELGKDYSAKTLEERLVPGTVAVPNQPGHSARQQEEGVQPQPTAAETKAMSNPPAPAQPKEEPTMLDTLLQVENVPDYLPYHLRKHKKKKKKR